MSTELTSADCPPIPQPDALTQFFWDAVAEHRLEILRCNTCGKFIHLPRPVCRFCLSTDLAPLAVSGRASLDTWTLPAQPFDLYYQSHLPYILAVVELEEQANLKMVTNIVNCPEARLRVGLPLKVTFSEPAPGVTLPLFTPAETEA
jgi:uncharacterized protein